MGRQCAYIFHNLNPMKHFLLPLFLLASAAPLLANDVDGDYAYMPRYQELVREGYGPRRDMMVILNQQPSGLRAVPKPTQAYYMKGQAVYYGYTPVVTSAVNQHALYAFGYPVDYFQRMMLASGAETNLDRYTVAVATSPRSPYEAG